MGSKVRRLAGQAKARAEGRQSLADAAHRLGMFAKHCEGKAKIIACTRALSSYVVTNYSRKSIHEEASAVRSIMPRLRELSEDCMLMLWGAALRPTIFQTWRWDAAIEVRSERSSSLKQSKTVQSLFAIPRIKS